MANSEFRIAKTDCGRGLTDDTVHEVDRREGIQRHQNGTGKPSADEGRDDLGTVRRHDEHAIASSHLTGIPEMSGCGMPRLP